MKPLLPSLRERKRYLVYEIISNGPIQDTKTVSKTFWSAFNRYLGELGCSQAGIMILEDKYNKQNQRGVIRVNNKFVDKIIANLALIDNIDNQKTIVNTVGVSGTLKKAQGKYIAA
ncbi:hypothetical protein HOK51_04515 [Candidatus Woesearchaeota archaeon]|jgi:ribonuclease P/MRP protein subunit POP5|nr:hypothetical protein [Candidatus Woesearchaeota archaeon]MBT6519087.1 hypothetical protein [Candidatus Woesearchaeota archaeon]MBT7367030.1 hypothetical protein [Candidatus Woesearchaeota archaeon]